MKEQIKILLKNIDYPDQVQLTKACERGAYTAVKKILTSDSREIIDEVSKSGLRGRGGAAFPTGKKWSFLAATKPAYLMANADESEPGTFKDRLLLERDPHLIIEGIMIAALAIQAEWACIYIRGEYTFPYLQMQAALKECYAAGILGDNIFGCGKNLNIVLHRGAGAYVCGEESAQLNALEAKRPNPRLKPPFPAVSGLYSSPTVINNIETLSNLPWIISNGASAYQKTGVENSRGTKLVSVSGCVERAGVYEIEMGYPLLELINNECGGIRSGHTLKAVFPGGSSVNILRADELKGVNLDYDSLKAAGSSLGCAGMIVLDETCSIPEAALNLAEFYGFESCGQCTPCREGTLWLKKILQRMVDGRAETDDCDLIVSICDQISGHTVCALGDTMAMPIKSCVLKFKDEFLKCVRA